MKMMLSMPSTSSSAVSVKSDPDLRVLKELDHGVILLRASARSYNGAPHEPGAPANARTERLLAAPIVPTLARLSAPGVLLVAFQSLVSVGDTYFVGRLGTGPLAGLALVFPLLMLLQMTSAGAMGGGVSSAIARARLGDAAAARRLVVHALVIAAMGAAFTILVFTWRIDLRAARRPGRNPRARAALLEHRLRRRDRGLDRQHAFERAARQATCSPPRSR